MNDSTVDWAHIINQALTVEQKDSIHYNQVAGREMKFYFNGTDIYKAEVTGNVQSIFYPEDEDSVMMGMNFIDASKLNLYRKDGKMERIVFITKPTGLLFREQVHGEVLGLLEVLCRHPLHIRSEEAVREVRYRARVGADCHPPLPVATAIARLLIELAARTLHRVFARLTHPCT